MKLFIGSIKIGNLRVTSNIFKDVSSKFCYPIKNILFLK